MPDMEGLPDITNALGFNPIWILLGVGLLLAFFGRTFFKVIWFLIGGLIMMTIALIIGAIVGYIIGQLFLCAGVAAFVGFIIGGFMGIAWAKILMCLATSIGGFWVGYLVAGIGVGIVVAGVVFLIAFLKFDDVLSVLSAAIGGLLVGAVAAYNFDNSLLILAGVSIPVMFAGMFVQLHIHERWPEHSYEEEKGLEGEDSIFDM